MKVWMTGNKFKVLSDARQTFAELGLDSILSVELMHYLEMHLGIQIDPTAVYDHPTVNALAEFLSLQYRSGEVTPCTNVESTEIHDDSEIMGW